MNNQQPEPDMEFELETIATMLGTQFAGDPKKIIRGAGPFETAGPDDLTLADDKKFLNKLHETHAAAVITPAGFAHASANLLLADCPRAVFAKALCLFYPAQQHHQSIHPSAFIGNNFTCGQQVHIAASVTVGDNVTLGDQVVLHPGVFLGDNVTIGDQVEIHPNVSVLWGSRIGDRVIIHAGTVIGSDGFGFAPDGEKYHKVPHTGIVQIDDDVEIGANNCIDRSTFGKTWIKSGVKTDNLVQIAHNVTIGEHTVIASGSGIAGSTTIGKHVVVAGHVGVAGHLTVGDRVTIGPKSGVLKSVEPDTIVSGMPAISHKLWLKAQSLVAKLPTLKKQIRELEHKLAAAEKANKGEGRDSSDSNR
jgi:UDP-3-O-[3-hydroxymyristoyl] glucosamine N-acyltransferase